ncbi:MAG: hypothetical protein WCK49_00975 [Myxococcaceae bacterium]
MRRNVFLLLFSSFALANPPWKLSASIPGYVVYDNPDPSASKTQSALIFMVVSIQAQICVSGSRRTELFKNLGAALTWLREMAPEIPNIMTEEELRKYFPNKS